MSAAKTDRPPLQAMRLVSQCLAVLGQRMPLFFLLAFLPALVFAALHYRLAPSAFAGASDAGQPAADYPLLALELGLSALGGLYILAVVTLAAYDARLDRPPRPLRYLSRALRTLPAVALLGVASYLSVAAGLLLLVLPGFYVAARLAVTTPAIVIEGAGFGGLHRSSELTEGYRWQIAGLFAAVLALVVLIDLAITAATSAMMLNAPGEPGVLLLLLVDALAAAIQVAVVAVFVAMLHARLRELRDGAGLDDLVEVFS